VALKRAGKVDAAARLFDAPERVIALVRAAWPAAVGHEIARRSQVMSCSDGTLVVRVPDGRWRRTLHRMRRTILRRLHEIAGERAPTRLGFTEGEVATNEGPAPRVAPLEPFPLSAELASSANGIADGEIRAAFERSAALYLARARRSTPSGPE
jgi:hypothetical protein